MFGKFSNNFSGNSVNVNTKLYTSYSDESLLLVSAWNTNLSVKFQPAIGKNADGLTEYSNDQNAVVNVTLTPESAEILKKGIEEEIIPAIKEKKKASIGIITGATDEKRKILNVITDEGHVGICVVYGTITVDGASSNSAMISHTFNERNYLSGYEKDKGGELKSVPSDFYLFYTRVKEITNIDGSIAHGIAYNNAFKSSYTNNGQQNASNNSNYNNTNTYNAPVTNIGDAPIDDFIPFN